MATEMKKTFVKVIKPLYLGMSTLDIRKTLMNEFWYDYIRPKYGDKAKLCYKDTDSFVVHIKIGDFFEDISNDVERWFDTSNYGENDKRTLPIGKNKKVPGLLKMNSEEGLLQKLLRLEHGYGDGNYEKNKIILKGLKEQKSV